MPLMKSTANSGPQGLLFYLQDRASADKLLKLLRENGINPVFYSDLQQKLGLPVYVIDPYSVDDALQRITSVPQPHPASNAIGRPRVDVTAETVVKAYYETGLPITQIMELYQISRSTVHRRLNEAAALGLHPRKYRKTDPNLPADNP